LARPYKNAGRSRCEAKGWEPHAGDEAPKDLDPALCAEIERAEAALERVEGAEEEDALVYSKDALRRASTFLNAQSAHSRKMYGVFAPVPDIGGGPNGSVDLHWRRKDCELLVNIPASDKELAAFYGDDYGTCKIKGSFDPTDFDFGIIMWLMKN
jgi:hypothetical protein